MALAEELQNLEISAPFLAVARHPDDPEVAIAADTSQFLAASQNNEIRAIAFEGYKNPELDAYLDSANEELQSLSIQTELKLGEENLKLKELCHPILFRALTELGNLFCQATGNNVARLKIIRPAVFKPHTHLTTDMTYAFSMAGTEWPNGQVGARIPFLFKSHFPHNTPKSMRQTPRTIAVFEEPAPSLPTSKPVRQLLEDLMHRLGL